MMAAPGYGAAGTKAIHFVVWCYPERTDVRMKYGGKQKLSTDMQEGWVGAWPRTLCFTCQTRAIRPHLLNSQSTCSAEGTQSLDTVWCFSRLLSLVDSLKF